MNLYLDASFLVALFIIDPFNSRADAFSSTHPGILLISDFGAAEFSSAIARRARMGDLSKAEGREAFLQFDLWLGRTASRELFVSADIAAADQILRRLDTPLRAPDAIHIAIAQRLDATLVTFDRQMADGARALGTAVATP